MPSSAASSKLIQNLAAEGRGFGGALNLDQLTGRRRDDRQVHRGPGILGIVEVQQHPAVHHADAHRRDLAAQRVFLEHAARLQPVESQRQGDESAGDGSGPGTPIRLDDVAVHPNGPLSKSGEGPRRPATSVR